ncbi:MAG TPA: DoxX family protein [Kofleriaceae bacterium]|nr:DoxX family protein [Kofleriaceae bacterium]
MLYRVDYLLALLAAGALAAALLSGRAAKIAPQRLARGYLIATAVTVAVRAALFIALFGAGVSTLPVSWFLVVGDLGIVLLGALYGIAIVGAARDGFAAALEAPQLRAALCLSVGIGFSLAGIGKMYSLDFMLDFFAQSHYTKPFLFVIIATEVIGGAAILLPWRPAVLAATAALGVVMFGAIYTHWHNGEPLDYSRDAIGMLLRLVPIAVICAGWRRAMLGAIVCCAAAIAGSALVRVAPAMADDFDSFVGSWQCSSTPSDGSTPVAADLHIDKQAGGRWLVLRLDEHPPGSRHLLAEWRRDPTGWIASVQDEGGGLGIYRSAGWQGGTLTWDGEPLDGGAAQRFVYERLDPVRFAFRHELQDAAGWRRLTTLTCIH